ncbi:S-adenosylmethionine:tRNA ribosyltransferase-isomerase [bioreactor metagenome]|uniref:S-adenosylmethionine:tRNA ribosyltransferase-isomerase n=1 Tax=bioreactor metagenome TaxID=1076179 RepID=A0A645AWR4_9ZZZZ
MIRNRFEEYLKTIQYDEPQRNGLFIEFLNNLQEKSIDEQMRFLRDEIKLKALITDFNHLTQYTLAGIRSKLDFVDNHQYWDHPSFPAKRWDYPFVFRNQSTISLDANNPRSLMPTRVFGKPFTVTEFNFCVPNTWRVECPSVFGGYAALQDWDGLYRFAWSHGRYGMQPEVRRPLSQFDIVNNVQAQMAERIIWMLFMRGDVKAAREAVAFEFRPEMVREVRGSSNSGQYPAEFSRLGLWGRIGSLTEQASVPGVQKVDPLKDGWQAALPAAANAAMKRLAEAGSVASATGEVTLHVGPGTFKPVSVADVASHKMHTERFVLPEATARLINATRANGGRIVAVGTTTVRTLESCCDEHGVVTAQSGATDIFLYPPYRPRAVDLLLTNFHLPKSTLLMLVSCFADREKVLAAYHYAIASRMRFYSYGDCMLFQ